MPENKEQLPEKIMRKKILKIMKPKSSKIKNKIQLMKISKESDL